MSGRRCDGEESKTFFFKKKQQKTFIRFGCRHYERAQPGAANVFWFLFTKKSEFLLRMRLVRALLFQGFFYVTTTLVCVIAGIPVCLFAKRKALPLARFWIRTILAGARLICGIRIAVTGREHLPVSGPALIACQHQSAIDTLLWFTLLQAPSYVMKQELTRVPIFGRLLTNSGMIPVDRGAGAQALRTLLPETMRMFDLGRQIVIFPEGTRVPPGERVPLQPGVAAIARNAGLSVIPVSLDSGRLWGRGALAFYPGVLHLIIHPPIPAGTPRGMLLARIEQAWHDRSQDAIGPVDKPVTESGAPLKLTMK